MKRYQILLFVYSVIAVLAAVCALFPSDGLRIGKMSLSFPTLQEILSPEVRPEDKPSPEELILMRKQAVRDAEKDRFEEFVSSDPARFYLPGDDPGFFDALFEAFGSAMEKPVRIVHYGDSQIEEDRITSTVRAVLQERFGGSGQGMMPARRHFTTSMGGGSTAELDKYTVFGERGEVSAFGPFGETVVLDTATVLSYFQVRGKDLCHFDKLTLLAGNIQGSLAVGCGGRTYSMTPEGALSELVLELPDSSVRVSVSLDGKAELYGVLLDSDKGIRMDNVPMRGCSGIVFTLMDSDQLRDFYRKENVRLIILQYGGNSVPYIKTGRPLSNYASAIGRQIRHLRKLAPDACIVFIGPSDMSTVVKGKRKTYPILGEVVDSLRAAANEAGAAYWDIYGAMGGEDSMVDWVAADPPLAGSDYVHFTPRGSVRIGEMFSDSFMLYYDYYLWRKKNDE